MKVIALLLVPAFLMMAVAAVPARHSSRITAVRDCSPTGPERIANVTGTILTDPVPTPGNMSIDLLINLFIDAPDNLGMKKVTTRKSDNFRVPCLDGISGTCTVPVCQAITNFPNKVCPLFPPEIPCACPIKAAVIRSQSNVEFDQLWTTINGGNFEGDYISRLDFTDGILAGARVRACIELEFTLVKA